MVSRDLMPGQITARRLSHEHMDNPDASREQLDEALRFIRIVNRRLGGTAAALDQFKRWSRDWDASATIRILDIGTGSADIPLAIAQWAESCGHRVQITAVDLHPVTLELARHHIGVRAEIQLLQADALRLLDQFAPASFDYVHAGMFLHHLNDVQVLTMLAIMNRLANRGVIWNDLIRGWIGRAGVRLATLCAPVHVKHDGLVSVDAGFTKPEALELARRADWRAPRLRRHVLHRFTVVSDTFATTMTLPV